MANIGSGSNDSTGKRLIVSSLIKQIDRATQRLEDLKNEEAYYRQMVELDLIQEQLDRLLNPSTD